MSKKKYDFAVFIGRMQPPHKGHIERIKTCLDLAEKTIIVLGSHRAARNIKNPWTVLEREMMIRNCFDLKEQERLIFTSVADHYYNDNVWVADVQEKVNEAVGDARDPEKGKYPRIVLVGCMKDSSSYYLELFPQWAKEIGGNSNTLNATDARNMYFDMKLSSLEAFKSMLETPVVEFLDMWKKTYSDLFNKLSDEWAHIQEYKEMWSSTPYPVTFSTTDVVVVKSGHVLMVRRKMKYGKGLLALPGGFIKQELSVIDSALEELKEETRIKVSKDVLLRSLKDEKVFDYPGRSLRGRTITHAYYFELPAGGELPYVKGDDDAEKALWIPITELFSRADEIFEDHLHIVNYFYSKPR